MLHPLMPALPSRILAAVSALVMLAGSAGVSRADNHISSTGAAILGGVAGLAIGAAIADSAHQRPAYYPPRYQPYPPPQPYPYPPRYAQPYPAYYPAYRPAYARTFSPAPGVSCNPRRGLCFNANGTVANRWTARVFGD